jgi:hypothetical protein
LILPIFMSKHMRTAISMVFLVAAFGFFLSGCKKDEEEADTTEPQQVTDDTTEEDTDTDTEEDDSPSTGTAADFSDFSASTQTVGDSDGKENSEYTLVSIEDTEMDGYHRFEFTLTSDDKDELPEVEATLVSSGGYISVRLDRVTSDQSGIDYQGSRDINNEGVLRLYHQVTPVPSEEVYQIGISEDTSFYLHEGENMAVLLDVRYPGSGDSAPQPAETADEEEFTTGLVELGDVNTAGDVKFTGYSWSAPPGVVRFVWSTSAVSGNTTPPTSASYDADDETVTVVFEDVASDAVIGSDGSFEADLASSIERVSGTRSGTTSTYVFYLTGEAEYRIYRSTSPNQVILEVQR